MARLVLDINLCPDEDPLTALGDVPDTILDLMEQLPELHTSALSIVLGQSFADGTTRRGGRRTLIQLVDPDDPVHLEIIDDAETRD